ncbi:hypothetical protein [Rickettsia asembonensis]|uniref:hypothetical protein n=1 Tax=Rickettsia asembonensis TaxID=1068590 RepID=UPI00130E23F9|nr:hypothetical protein [Rickettsia asembonensis]
MSASVDTKSVIARSEATWQSSKKFCKSEFFTGLPRRFAPRNDDSATQQRPNSLKQ